MVLPLPDETALQTGRVLEGVPVVGERTVRVSHRVAVLAHDERPCAAPRRSVPHDALDRCVHRADHVGGTRAALHPVLHRINRGQPAARVVLVVHGPLVVDGTRRVVRAHPRCGRVVHRAVAALVAEGPHDDARVVLVALHHAGHARHDRGAVARVVAQARVPGVALHVRLVDHVETQFVAQVQEPRVVRVVRTAHRVHVVLLHQHDVGAHVRDRHGLAPFGMVVVAVHALDHHAGTVHEQVPALDLDPAEPRALVHGLRLASPLVDERHRDTVQHGQLGRPRPHPGDQPLCAGDMAVEHVGPRVVRDLLLHRGEHAPVRGRDLDAHAPSLRHRCTAVRSDCREHAQRPRGVVVLQAGVDADVLDVHGRLRPHVHLAVQAGHPPLVLVLHVTLGREPADHDDDGVVAIVEQVGHVVLARQAAVGAVAGPAAVHDHRVHALGAAHMEDDAPAVPLRGHREHRPVHHRGDHIGQCRGQALPRHRDVRVVRLVAEAEECPVAGDGDRPPVRVVEERCEHLGGNVSGMPVPHHGPLPVERAEPRVALALEQRAAHRQAVHGDDLGVGDRPCFLPSRECHAGILPCPCGPAKRRCPPGARGARVA